MQQWQCWHNRCCPTRWATHGDGSQGWRLSRHRRMLSSRSRTAHRIRHRQSRRQQPPAKEYSCAWQCVSSRTPLHTCRANNRPWWLSKSVCSMPRWRSCWCRACHSAGTWKTSESRRSGLPWACCRWREYATFPLEGQGRLPCATCCGKCDLCRQNSPPTTALYGEASRACASTVFRILYPVYPAW